MNLGWDEMYGWRMWVVTVGAEDREVTCLETSVEPLVFREAPTEGSWTLGF